MFKFIQFVWEESRMIGGFSRLMRLFAFLCSIYFKSMCLITIPLLDAVTFDALSWSHGRRRNIWTSSFVSSSRSSSTIVSRFGLSVVGLCSSGHFHAITSDCLSLNIFIRDQKRFSQGLLQLFIHLCMERYSYSRNDFHKVFYNRLSFYVSEDTDWVCICPLTEVRVLLHTTFDDA